VIRNALIGVWPTLLVASACVGLASANWLEPPAVVAAVGLVACVGAAVVTGPLGRAGALAAALLLAGLWWGSLRLDALDRSWLVSQTGKWSDARVVVTGPARRTPFSVRAPAEVKRFAGKELRERVLLELPAGRAPPIGAVLDLRAQPVPPRGPETGFDERGWLDRRGVHVVLTASRWSVVGRRGGIGGVGDRLRTHVAYALSLGTSGEREALVAGVVLGADEGVSEELRDAFRASGLYHLMAVSGQNVTFLALGTVVALWLLGCSSLAGHAVAIAAVLAYGLAVGWQPSVVRAGVAGCLASLAWLTSRPQDRWHFLALGALVLLAWTPASLLEPGFQLSFTAVAAIFVVVPRVRRAAEGYPVRPKAADLLAVAVACGVATAPILWLQFGVVPLWTVPANALAEPAMPALLGLGLGAAALEPLLPSAAVALSWLAGWCAAWLALLARFFSSLPHAELESGAVLAALGAAPVLALLVWMRRRPGLLAAAAGLVAVAALGWWLLRPVPSWAPPAGLRVTFLDVGQGDAVLLEVVEGAILVDQGPPEADVANQLRRLGLRSLSAVVLTHPQRDHVGGAADVLRRLQVDTVLDPVLPAESPDQSSALATARSRRVPVVVARAGAAYRLGRLRLRVLWPDGPGTPGADPNLRPIVLVATYGSTDVLLPADAESGVTLRLPLRPVEVLKVAHHGSEDPGLAEQLLLLRPRIAVISVGARNDYGHPRPETLAALATVPGLRLFRTDLDGRVVVESDGATLQVRSAR
jgi:competence protein ComEC